MKRYGNLYHKVYDMDNLRLAHINARKKKTYYSEVKMIDKEPEKYLSMISNMLKNKSYQNSSYTKMIRKFKNEIPFLATIRKINKYYSFT